jgi:hypothetical protein
MAGYIGSKASVVSSGAERKKTFAITGTTTVLTGVSYTPTFVHLFHNGVRLVDGTDYTATNGTSITLTSAAESGDEVVVISYASFQPSDTVSASAGGTFAGDVSVTGAFTSLGIDDNATSTAITIDASGNVLVGTTNEANYNNNAGTTADDGFVYNSASGILSVSSYKANAGVGYVQYLNRTNTDGGIIEFRKDGTTVGSIGADGGDLLISPANVADSIRIGPTGEVALLGANSNTWVGFSGIPLGGGGRRCQLWQTQGSTTGRPSMLLESHSGGGPLGVNSTFDDTANRDVVRIYRRGVQVGSISGTTSATSYNTTSDYRLKENITPVQGAADIVKAMQPVTYTFKSDGSWHDGFLAHELQELHPRAVIGEKDAMKDEEYEVTPAVLDEDGAVVTEAVMGTRSVPDYQGVDYSKLTPILTAALQEALNKIDALEARLTALEATP